jgi:phosphoribosyl-AMP cyclohydrolase
LSPIDGLPAAIGPFVRRQTRAAMTEASSPFAPRPDEEAVEAGTVLSPRFDADGLIVAIATDADSGEVLMVAHMNREALARTIATGEAWFWSRSRRRLWRKGEESGNALAVVDMRVDCDQDAILIRVRVAGAGVACHTGYRSCFYRSVPLGAAPTPDLALVFDETMPRARRPR